MKQLTVDGVEIAYLDEGNGPAIVHRPLLERLAQGMAAADRDAASPTGGCSLPISSAMGSRILGPPTSSSPPTPIVDVVLAVAKKAKGKLHLVGHSYGAALALEAARTLGSRVKSLTLVEPVPVSSAAQGGPNGPRSSGSARAVLGAVARGDDRAAAAAFMSYWLGRFRWWLSPERFKSAIAATIPKVALEFGIIIDAPTTLAGLCRDHGADAPDRRAARRARPTAPSSIFSAATLPNATGRRC